MVESAKPINTPIAKPVIFGIIFTIIPAQYAPIHINPACPNENWPHTPITKFKETAKIILIKILYRVME